MDDPTPGARGGGSPADDPSPGDADLAAWLRRLFEEGQRAFPGLDLTLDTFVHHLAGRAPPPAQRAPELYLACACAAQVRGAHEAFDRAYLRRVDEYLAGMRPSATFVDDVRQALREKLFVGRSGSPPKIAEYDGRGALESWVRIVALRAAVDLHRRSPRPAAEAPPHEEAPTGTDPELGYLKQRYRDAFNTAFRGAIAALGAEPRDLLRLHFVDGLTLDQLAQRTGVHRATVARRIAAAREAITDEARRLLRAALGASDPELDSLAGVMRSQIELSLPGLLVPVPAKPGPRGEGPQE